MEAAAIAARRHATAGFEDFFRGEYPAVYRAVFLATGDPQAAEDATQEAFERAFARWRRLSRHDWAGGWMMTTALNACKRSLRRRNLLLQDQPDVLPPPATSTADVTAALKAIPFRQSQAALLYYIGDLPIAAVANLMGISEGTVKAHLSQARASLRDVLGENYV